MGTFFGNIGHALVKGASDVASEAKRDYNRVTNQKKADPTHFADGTPVPNNSPTPPINTGPQAPPGSGSASGFNSTQQQQFLNAVRSDKDISGVWDTITGLGGDAWGVITKLLPKNADGSIDWGKVGGDIAGWLKANKGTIIDGLNAYNQYNRQQQSDKYAKKATDLAEQHYAEKQPLRDAGMAGMLDPHAGTPDLSALKTQGQSGLGIQAPLPVAAPNTNFQNAQKIAGPGSGNPFAQPTPLPVAPPSPTMPGQPSQPGQPGQPMGRPLTPSRPTPLPIGGPVSPLTPMAATDTNPSTSPTPLPLRISPSDPPMPGLPLHISPSSPTMPQALPMGIGTDPLAQQKKFFHPGANARPALTPFDPRNPEPIPIAGTVGY